MEVRYLKTRIISAFVALLIVVPLVLLGGVFYEVLIAFASLLALKEIYDLKKSHKSYPNTVKYIGMISLLLIVLSNFKDLTIYNGISYQILALTTLFILMPTVFYKNNEYKMQDAIYLLGIILFLGLSFNIFLIIRLRNIKIFGFLILIPTLNDIFAYLIGSKFGKHKMCEKISPHKTWEGSLGGLLVGTIGSIVYYYFLIGNINLKVIAITIILSVAGQIGDLVMSKIKRENEIKDFSNLMPGHGGMLDRLDSTIFVFMTYMFLMIF